MLKISESNSAALIWINGALRLADMLDNRMTGLLKAIDPSSFINQAAKQLGLSYKKRLINYRKS